VLEPYRDVRQKVLITDDEPAQRAFYESMGFTETGDRRLPDPHVRPVQLTEKGGSLIRR
jgi:hypothetical protein